jgi:preprotein translocase subunit SecE
MATKTTAIERGGERSAKRQEPGALQEFGGGAMSKWNEFTRFLSDVRAEMRKVVAPGRKEVEVTTTVVIITVFIFGLFFFVVDAIFKIGINSLLQKLVGMH